MHPDIALVDMPAVDFSRDTGCLVLQAALLAGGKGVFAKTSYITHSGSKE